MCTYLYVSYYSYFIFSQDVRRKAARLVAAKSTLAARVDSFHQSANGAIGESEYNFNCIFTQPCWVSFNTVHSNFTCAYVSSPNQIDPNYLYHTYSQLSCLTRTMDSYTHPLTSTVLVQQWVWLTQSVYSYFTHCTILTVHVQSTCSLVIESGSSSL